MITANRTFLDAIYRIAKRTENEAAMGIGTDKVIDFTCEDASPEGETDNYKETTSNIGIKTEFETEENNDHEIPWTELTEELFNSPDNELSFHDDGFSYYESCAQSLCNVTNLLLQDEQGFLQDEESLDDFSNPSDVTILEKVIATRTPLGDGHYTSSKRFMLNEGNCENQPSTSAQSSKRRPGRLRKTENLSSVSTEIGECSQDRETRSSKRYIEHSRNDALLRDSPNLQHSNYSTLLLQQVSLRRTPNVDQIGKQAHVDTQISSKKSHRSKKIVSDRPNCSEMSENDDPFQEQADTVGSISSKTAKHFNKKIMTERYKDSPDLLSSPLRKINLFSPYRKLQSESPCKAGHSRTKDNPIEIKLELNDMLVSDLKESESSATQKIRQRKRQTELQQTSHPRRKSIQREEAGCQRGIEKDASKSLTLYRNNYSLRSNDRRETSQNDQANDQYETDKKAKRSSKKFAAYSPDTDTSPVRSTSFSRPHGKGQSELPHKPAQCHTRIFEYQQDEELEVPLPPWRCIITDSSSPRKPKHSSKKVAYLSAERGTDSPDTSPVQDPSISSQHHKCESERPHKKVQSRTKSKQSGIEMKQDDEDVPHERYNIPGTSSSGKAKRSGNKAANLSSEKVTDSPDTSPVRDASIRHCKHQSERAHKKIQSRTKGKQNKIEINQNGELISENQRDENLVYESPKTIGVPPERYSIPGSSPSKKSRRSGNKAADLSAEKGSDTSPVRNTCISSRHRKCQSERPYKKIKSRNKSKQRGIEMEKEDELVSECQQDEDFVSESSNFLGVPHEHYNVSGSASPRKYKRSSKKFAILSAERCADSTDTSPVRDASISSLHRKCQSERHPNKKVQSRTKGKQSKVVTEHGNELISECPQDKDVVSSSRKANRSSKQVGNLSAEKCAVSAQPSTSPVRDASVSSQHRQGQSERLHKKVRSRARNQKTETEVERLQNNTNMVSMFSATLSVPTIEPPADIFDSFME